MDIVTLGAAKSAIKKAVSGLYKPAGSTAFADLPTPAVGNLGYTYIVTDAFTSDSRFTDYDTETQTGHSYPADTEVTVVITGTEESPVYMLNVMGSIMDGYATKAEVAAIINDTTPSNLTAYSGNKVEEIAGLKLDRTDLTISEEIVLYADMWVGNQYNTILFPRNINDTIIAVPSTPTATTDYCNYGIKLSFPNNNLRLIFTCDIVPSVDIPVKIITLKVGVTSNADAKIDDVVYNSSDNSYYCTYDNTAHNDYSTVENGIIAISSAVPLSNSEADAALDMCYTDITTQSIDEPLTIAAGSGLYWYIRAYVIYSSNNAHTYHCIKYSNIISAYGDNITEINNTAREGIWGYESNMGVDPEEAGRFTSTAIITVPNNNNRIMHIYGIISTQDEETANAGLTLNTVPVEGMTYVKQSAVTDRPANPLELTWRKKNALGQIWWVRPYVTLSDGSTNTTYYGRMESFTMPSA